ncbi:MAG: hypothetical protein K8I29_09730 [Alphaproteobacteria bacterium]|uniref:Uncharacterized protein n=1 Tax=Candidatus Nitrobium versatile TaxID=2884831 RepID=A0A953JEX2_9BACT|nr:hypothetical protein [Candidatus Nitrobium versatile]
MEKREVHQKVTSKSGGIEKKEAYPYNRVVVDVKRNRGRTRHVPPAVIPPAYPTLPLHPAVRSFYLPYCKK